MTPETPRFVYDFDAPPATSAIGQVQLLGGKGANLVVMANELGLPVPPGFIVTTKACREYLAGKWPEGLDGELMAAMVRLGDRTGRRFGDPNDPLLVSVRSGAPVSMPGMMDTLLDLGLTDSAVTGLARSTGSTDFAADCRRRLEEGWRSVVGGEVPGDAWDQLRQAVEAVFRSWNSERARAYRKREGIADDLGTAVTVQAMVFGNRGETSGTGVLFTRNPSTGEQALYGDFMFNAQGEDVVAGRHETLPIAALEERLPDVAAELRRIAGVIERHLRDVADIEFTVEQGRLWMLQFRTGKRSPRAALRMALEMADNPEFPLTREEAVERVSELLADPPREFVFAGEPPQPIATGLPASPGVATGAVVTSPDAARASTGAVILVRAETSPEDVPAMARAAGVLTSRGGLASHAAVVARGWGIPAVVGATGVRPADDHVVMAGRRLDVGEMVTIDGSTGAVYAGELAGTWERAPEVATLLAWARELGIEVVTARQGEAGPAPVAERSAALTADDVLRALAIKGGGPIEKLAEALAAELAAIEDQIGRLREAGFVESAAGEVRLTASGRLAATDLFTQELMAIGVERATALLGEFHELDVRMKDIVTAWQIRDVDGEQVLNDHSDPAYDSAVLDSLASLHAETATWLAPLAGDLWRFGVYRSRLERAASAARSDQRYVASPRVDSYHSVWFELHEDLIRLAGRKRSEVAS